MKIANFNKDFCYEYTKDSYIEPQELYDIINRDPNKVVFVIAASLYLKTQYIHPDEVIARINCYSINCNKGEVNDLSYTIPLPEYEEEYSILFILSSPVNTYPRYIKCAFLILGDTIIRTHRDLFKPINSKTMDNNMIKTGDIIEKKRTDYIGWEEYFMGIAKLTSLRSKDPRKQVGCCIVRDHKILSVGYNGFPNNCSDDEYPWNSANTNPLEVKDFYVVHAELNAILNSNFDLKDSTVYTTLFPCNECAKALIQVGVKEVIFLEDKDSIKTQAAKRMFKTANINCRKYDEE